ncbi:MAG TPA: thioredoxin domain-containing protein [Bryobacteraceae bacterium]|nr:thioredoxin domain-containing protein [Bryobacteraceae bacterium]
MHTNRLAGEKSPYLLQHAHNPVDWYPWGPEAFETARSQNKPIFLSIGYSTCHWCHVMERESFENEQIAAELNRGYIPIKVDREERPDVDRIYMTFVQATTGGGGWPMSVWLTPELQPFFGGTYFPPEDRWGHPGFGSVLRQIAAAWQTDRAQIVDSARDVVEQLRQQAALTPVREGVAPAIDAGLLDSGFFIFRRTFDTRLGGFGAAPKFPRPVVFHFLLRYWARTGNREALDMVLLTLREMAKGGMNDQLGGGFHRYSVDERWFVPHFEKMLYDQAQLAVSYLEAFQITGDAVFAETARRTLDYVLRDMTDSAGGFYSAEDADSVIDRAHPEEKGEGAFYIWGTEEIRKLVAQPAADWFAYRYGMEEPGNVANDPHEEFTGKNILFQAHTVVETASHFGVSTGEVERGIGEAARVLYAARSTRVRPHLDDKVLTGWNGLMISALALGGAVLGEERYAEAARRAAGFLVERMYDEKNGTLLRRYREGEAAIAGFLEDYALFAQGLLDLYEAQFDLGHLQLALRLTEKQRELFEDREQGGYFSSAEGDASLVLRVKEDYDGAEPSGNSVAVRNLLRLAEITNRADLRASAERTLAAFGPRLRAVPVALPQLLEAAGLLLAGKRQIILVGERDAADTRALASVVAARFVPDKIVLLVDSPESRAVLSGWIPSIASMEKTEGRAAAYVCRDYTCQLPVSEADKLAELLQ